MQTRPAEMFGATTEAIQKSVRPTVGHLPLLVCLGPGFARATPDSSSTGADPGPGHASYIEVTHGGVSRRSHHGTTHPVMIDCTPHSKGAGR